MRAFLREPSTPWIVFDQDVRPPSQLASGEVVPWRSALSSVMPEHGFFPATAIVDAQHHVTPLEPSSLAVAADLADEAAAAPDHGSSSIPMRGLSRRVLGAAAGGAAMLAVLAIGLAALSASPSPLAERAPAAANAPASGELVPPDLDVKAAAPAAVAPAVAPPVAPESRPLAQRFGRLAIVGDARGRDVFLDGKRLLGKGTRSFTVTCGTHAIAVGARADAHDLDVPCNAELTVGK